VAAACAFCHSASPYRALKTKHETPKYGLIYHASLIGQSQPKFKGKISRVLAAKCALAIRVDALGDTTDAAVGTEARAKVRLGTRKWGLVEAAVQEAAWLGYKSTVVALLRNKLARLHSSRVAGVGLVSCCLLLCHVVVCLYANHVSVHIPTSRGVVEAA
jgi:hypothetical protein